MQELPTNGKSSEGLCQYSLNGARDSWDNSELSRLSPFKVKQRRLSTDNCRTVAQQSVATASETTDRITLNADSSEVPSSSPPKKVVPVIGNSACENSPVLANPHNDAGAVAITLGGLGFEVISGLDLLSAATISKVREFAKTAKTADLALLFYAGHGLQIGGENDIVLVDAKVEDETAISFELINVSIITNFMGGLDKVGIALLDACRDNPLSRSLKRSLSASRAASVDQGLATISAEGGCLFNCTW